MAIRAPNIRQPSYSGAVRPLAERGVREDVLDGRKLGKKRSRHSLLDPYDVMAAVARLAALLTRDVESGIPDDIPTRGYYLNILV